MVDHSNAGLEYLQRLLTTPETGIAPAAQQAFLHDMEEALTVQQGFAVGGISGVRFAPYVDPFLTEILDSKESGVVRPEAFFPGLESTSVFSILIRPVDMHGGKSNQLICGAPLLVQNTIPLAESGLLERTVDSMRFGKKMDPATDGLTRIVRALSGQEGSCVNQDIVFDPDIPWGTLFSAYKKENEQDGYPAVALDTTQVTRAIAMLPRNPEMYRTECMPLVGHRSKRDEESMCFGYGKGGCVYRGRPIIPGNRLTRESFRQLADISTEGIEAWYDVKAVGELRDVASNHRAGNFVVVALPLVGERQQYSQTSTSHSSGEELIMSAPEAVVDYAALGTGTSTGIVGKLVPGKFDHTRPVGILDVTLLTYTPGNMQRVAEEYFH